MTEIQDQEGWGEDRFVSFKDQLPVNSFMAQGECCFKKCCKKFKKKGKKMCKSCPKR